jgi:hypothetical protein
MTENNNKNEGQNKMKNWYIKQRHNPQLGTYFVPMGQMLKARATEIQRGSLYGSNTMLAFPTEEAYNLYLNKLREEGKRVQ